MSPRNRKKPCNRLSPQNARLNVKNFVFAGKKKGPDLRGGGYYEGIINVEGNRRLI